jgi:hypothetical protein
MAALLMKSLHLLLASEMLQVLDEPSIGGGGHPTRSPNNVLARARYQEMESLRSQHRPLVNNLLDCMGSSARVTHKAMFHSTGAHMPQ